MPFDKDAEAHEPEFRIELIFSSGRPEEGGLSMPPSAYIAMGSYFSDEEERPKITTEHLNAQSLHAEVEYIKGQLDARVADAKARFAAAGVG
jgi:galactokinase